MAILPHLHAKRIEVKGSEIAELVDLDSAHDRQHLEDLTEPEREGPRHFASPLMDMVVITDGTRRVPCSAVPERWPPWSK